MIMAINATLEAVGHKKFKIIPYLVTINAKSDQLGKTSTAEYKKLLETAIKFMGDNVKIMVDNIKEVSLKTQIDKFLEKNKDEERMKPKFVRNNDPISPVKKDQGPGKGKVDADEEVIDFWEEVTGKDIFDEKQ